MSSVLFFERFFPPSLNVAHSPSAKKAQKNAQVALSLAMTLRLDGAGARRLAEVMVEEEFEGAFEGEDADEEEKPLPLLPPPLLAAALPPPFLPPPPPPPLFTITLARRTAGTRCSACADRTRASS